MTELPVWAGNLDGPLRESFGGVWRRLPEYARLLIESVAPQLVAITNQQAIGLGWPDDRWGQLWSHCEPGETATVEIRLRSGGDPAETRFAIAHELAHVVLRHHELSEMNILMGDGESQHVRFFIDDHADYVASRWLPDEFEFVLCKRPGSPRWYRSD